MKDTIEKNIELIKERVEFNRLLINNNQENIREVLLQPLSTNRLTSLLYHFQLSTDLFSKNRHLIMLQFELHRSLIPGKGLKTFGMMSLS